MNKIFLIIFSFIAPFVYSIYAMDMNLENIIQKKIYTRDGYACIKFITQFSDGTREIIKQKTNLLTHEKKYTYSCEGKKNMKEYHRIEEVFEYVAEVYTQQKKKESL